MDIDYLKVDKSKNKKGEDTIQFKEYDGKLLIKQYSGINTDNFIIKKTEGLEIRFSFIKLNGIYYVSINGEHIIDYKRFVKIEQISKIENTEEQDKNIEKIKIKNTYIGDIIINNCDTELIQKALTIMTDYMKNKTNYISDFIRFVFT